jgi:acyl-CoA thioesterase-1
MSLERRTFLAALLAAGVAGCGRKPRLPALAAGETVLALGDSITFGTGAAPEASYPTVLARLTGWNIVNAGIPGDTSAGALARLPGLLQEHSPKLVLVSIGGNDFLRKVAPAETRANILRICQQASAAAQVVLVGIPEFNLLAAVGRSLGDHAMYGEIAKELKLPLHTGGWAKVLSDPSLRSDAIHANAQGYAKFAEGLAETLKDVGVWKV